MVEYVFVNGNIADANQVNTNFSDVTNYTSITAVNMMITALGETNYTNLIKDKLDTSTKIYSTDGFVFNATDERVDALTDTAYFVDIHATSVTTTDFDDFECQCKLVSADVWRISCDYESTKILNKARVMKNLWTDNQNISTGATSVTALVTNDSADVGKRMVWGYNSAFSNDITWMVASFDNTTDNTSMETWCYQEKGAGGANPISYVPDGTVLYTGLKDNLLEAPDTFNNPADFELYAQQTDGSIKSAKLFFLIHGGITVGSTQGANYDTWDSVIDDGLPTFTTYSGTSYLSSPSIVFNMGTVNASTKFLPLINRSFEDGTNIISSLEVSDDLSTWESAGDFGALTFSSSITQVYVRVTMTRTVTTKVDSLLDVGVQYLK